MAANEKRPGEISQMLNVTGATLRNYVKHFGDFLSPGANEKTRKRFNQEDVKTLQFSKSLLDEGYTYDQVIERLKARPVTGEILEDDWQPQPEPDPEPIKELEGDFQLVRTEFVKIILDQTAATLAAKDEVIQSKDEHIKYLENEIKRLKTPFFKRIFGRYDS